METPKSDTLEVNLRGRILLGAARHGVRDPRRVAVLARAIVAVVEHCHPEERPSLRQLEPLLTEQLALLEAALVNARAQEAPALAVAAPVAAQTAGPEDEASETAEEPPRGLRRRTLKGKGHTVVAKSMEEKLREGRQPVQELLRNDCVQLGLIDRKQVERLIRGMLGKQPEVAEQDVVEVLRQILQDQVKGIIRRLKGGPWATPQAQEEMRQDIHHARSVRVILMLARQVIKERRAWEKKHGKGLFGGLFGGRRGLGG
ncbi:hypothetical protein [endosymbiont of unidentified scaly snail isolate Monju]|uniref:hypothetical protein n=1 Tax=endosymbiont of unidentified scaly snail isolate Monju TaxID=1248727 RepID=UPI0005BBF118|nr:hypothetical protein [endosymbiont of unidentified scaly snail isolate Monju]